MLRGFQPIDLRGEEDRLRFAVHRPGSPEASPRSHRMPCGDIPGRVHVSVAGVAAGHAAEQGLALAAARCDVPARAAALRRVSGVDFLNSARGLLLQTRDKQAPAGGEYFPVQAGLVPYVSARVLDGSPGRAGHARDPQIFDPDHIESACQTGACLLNPVFAGVRLAGFQPCDGQLHLGAAAGAAPSPRKTALETAKPALPLKAEPGSAKQLARRQCRADRHTSVDAHEFTRTGRGKGLWNHGKRDMPASGPVPSDPVGLRRRSRAGPAEAHPARLRNPHSAGFPAKPTHMLRLHGDNAESLVAPGLPPGGLTARASEKALHGLGVIPERLLLHHLASYPQPCKLCPRCSELTALLQIAWGALAARPPVLLLLDSQIPHEPGMRAVLQQHSSLHLRGLETVPGHASTLAPGNDILHHEGRVRRFPSGPEAKVSAPQR